MTDKELLELAAKACGFELGEYRCLSSMPDDYLCAFWVGGKVGHYWNALEHDGDALCLAVALRLDIEFFGPTGVRVNYMDEQGRLCTVEQLVLDDPTAEVRRAIVRAAAEIGQNS
jgi:hypothetical protein